MTDLGSGCSPERTRRLLTGWCGVGLVASILVNGPLSNAIGRVPTYWSADAPARFTEYLHDGGRVNMAIVFFALSNLIFVFGIGFFAGIRSLAAEIDRTGWVANVVGIAASLFLAGGLLSETLSTGIVVVLRSTPAYHLDINTVLLLQGLWATALAQGQVALGLIIGAVSAAALRSSVLPRWLCWYGLVAAVTTILRVGLVTHTVLWIALLQPGFLWIVAIAFVSLRQARRAASSLPTPEAHLTDDVSPGLAPISEVTP
jgi:hypothetical protein